MHPGGRLNILHIFISILISYYGLSIETNVQDLHTDYTDRKEMKNIGHKMCIKGCSTYNNQTCKSYRYDRDSFVCSLNEENVVGLSNNSNHWDGERSEIPTNLSGPCSKVSCKKNERCVVLHGGKGICMIFACDKPPPVPYAVVNDGPVHVTATRSYRCISGNTSSGVIVCKASGSWTRFNFTCEKGLIPFSTPFKCSVSSLDVVGVCGQMTEPKRFTINLSRGSDIPLQLDFRIGEAAIIANSFRGHWGYEIRKAWIDGLETKSICAVINRTNGGYLVSLQHDTDNNVMETTLFKFPDRGPGNYTTISVTGAFNITSIDCDGN